ncbi:hypothetical protein N7466_011133 [Penicillium verhagenii]|uniref:uncharacterized protein n=1 Tax=Penicillium verhagenii TaxID=1562060 RepID=UPI0025457073|nr:uncharacterized protein N7466_011106 [Penicillium verhagenii]XP_057016254.1 uncharacterized protein N7466_011133 [Penicillium verhagenii]KAJ5917552.1 hypothetical protein N7466_011106 [Penicillium verhagenii]KAJ5917579.1 hypothetical protein N7466_011133 [Penicillium verhagenii]
MAQLSRKRRHQIDSAVERHPLRKHMSDTRLEFTMGVAASSSQPPRRTKTSTRIKSSDKSRRVHLRLVQPDRNQDVAETAWWTDSKLGIIARPRVVHPRLVSDHGPVAVVELKDRDAWLKCLRPRGRPPAALMHDVGQDKV